MKNKTKLILPLFLVFCLLLPLAVSNNNVKAALTANDPYMIGVNTFIEGYYGANVNLALSGTNASEVIPVISLESEVFTATDQKVSLYQTDGISRTYSSSMYTSITTSYASARGIFDTLRAMDETEFNQKATEYDMSIYTFSPLESFDKTINDTIIALDDTLTNANFSCSKIYTVMTFDRVLVDEFFTAAKAKGSFADIAADSVLSSDPDVIRVLLDEIFGARIFDIIYSPYNRTLDIAADSTWTIHNEIVSVMGGNATDSSVNGTTGVGSMRNGVFGFLGKSIVADSVVGQALSAYIPEDVFSNFKATPTTYSFQFTLTKTDYANSAVGLGMGAVFSMFQPAIVSIGGVNFNINFADAILIGLAAGAVAGILGFLIAKSSKKENAVLIGFIVFIVVAAFVFIGVAFGTMAPVVT